MGLKMPAPVLIGSTYYLRVHVPADVAPKVRGKSVSVPVAGMSCVVRINGPVKVSLRTKDAKEAKARFAAAHAALEAHWEAVRNGPQALTHKQSLALAGALRAFWVDAFDEDPGSPKRWQNVQEVNAAAKAGRLSLPLIGKDAQLEASLNARFGPIVDAFLAHKGILLAPESRLPLLRHVADAMDDAAKVTEAKAMGDYSQQGKAALYPALDLPVAKPSPKSAPPSPKLTFSGVIDAWVAAKTRGRNAAPVRPDTERKYRRECAEFVAFRGSDDMTTVTAREAEAWLNAMLTEAKLSNNSIRQRLQNIRSVVEHGRRQSLGELFPMGNPLEFVQLPEAAPVASDLRTLTLAEAEAILRAARAETRPELRWLPWLCAYSGARVNEVAQLTPGDFFQVGEDWFYRLTTMGGKTLKNRHSERRVPVHPDLVAEGLIVFVESRRDRPEERLFPRRSQGNVATWVREKVGLTRPELAPSHGWRHLFEDKALVAGMLDAARLYLTGRSGGGSAAGYGKSEVMLPGLAAEMRKVEGILHRL
ncbi:DUF6538 domain-containing protein [Rhodobacter capsulatus]|uniref:DUF6538 domain-containing protein n=1 Tax=Rhodobacter capsulatus TaxID=1061 RepID=UPI0015E893F9|nr:DUF6538 domain-containing protein [Rhodobacter capsulatus]